MRVLSAEPEKRGLDLSGSAQFRALSSESKDRLLQLLASVGTLESLNLRGLRLKSTNAGGVAELIKCSPRLRTLSVERNALDRAAIVQIGEAARQHPSLRELLLAEQRVALNTTTIERLIEVVEETPTLEKLGVGAIRDTGLCWRLQTATLANTERRRRARRGSASTGGSVQTSPRSPIGSSRGSHTLGSPLGRLRGAGEGGGVGGGRGGGRGAGTGSTRGADRGGDRGGGSSRRRRFSCREEGED